MKSQCPSDLGNGVVMKDVNFYEKDKVLEYVCSIASVESIDAPTIGRMKVAMVEALSGSKSGFGQLSVKIVLKQYGYKFRYIYQDTAGKKLCQIDITKDDLK
ncbi:MAG: hypothetical protein BGN96_05790 [Bacteroidales bacterium 45-6]|nr:MAG: hypothetical protein BGN96_05790 [Bacteroidales bacterium 45-6]